MTKQLIWFQHMHKVAGTSIVNLAKRNGLNLYQPNLNGNPQYLVGVESEYETTEIRYDRFPKPELSKFIDKCIDLKIQFIGCEWGFPEETLTDDRVLYLTCFRNPWSRFVSNFSYDHYEYPEKYPDIKSWLESEKPQYGFTRNNYYTFILAGLDYHHKGPVTEVHFQKAQINLNKFQLVLILEDPHWLKLLEFKMGWFWGNLSASNQTKQKVDLSEYQDQFMIDNIYDYRLYEQAYWLAKAHKHSYIEIFKSNHSNDRKQIIFDIKQLDKNDQKEIAVNLGLYILARHNSATLRSISTELVKLITCFNEFEIVNIQIDLKYILEILHLLSYIAYYTKYRDFGKQLCQILIETPIEHNYRSHAKTTLKFY